MRKIEAILADMKRAEAVWKANKPPAGTKEVKYQSDIPWPTPDSPRQNLHHDVCDEFLMYIMQLDTIGFLALGQATLADFWNADDGNSDSAIAVFCLFHAVKRRFGLDHARQNSKFLFDIFGTEKFCDVFCWVWHERMPFVQKKEVLTSLMYGCTAGLHRDIKTTSRVRIHWPMYRDCYDAHVPHMMTAENFRATAEYWACQLNRVPPQENASEIREAFFAGQTIDKKDLSPITEAYGEVFKKKRIAHEAPAQKAKSTSPWGKKPDRAEEQNQWNGILRQARGGRRPH